MVQTTATLSHRFAADEGSHVICVLTLALFCVLLGVRCLRHISGYFFNHLKYLHCCSMFALRHVCVSPCPDGPVCYSLSRFQRSTSRSEFHGFCAQCYFNSQHYINCSSLSAVRISNVFAMPRLPMLSFLLRPLANVLSSPSGRRWLRRQTDRTTEWRCRGLRGGFR